MKTIRLFMILDFWGQLALIVATAVGGLVGALYLGAWQLISAFIALVAIPRLRIWRQVYFGGVAVYFLGLTADVFGPFLVIGMPAVLAVFCLVITAEQVLSTGKSGRGFLPHTSF